MAIDTPYTQRLADLLKVVQDIAAGNFSVRARKEKDDIVGMLAVGINMMIDDTQQVVSSLEESNQQLVAGEQQLRATNRQLHANEQELQKKTHDLVALNQQLSANEQQLRATNQQLHANEQELQKKTHDLGKRMKEQRCLYDIADLMTKQDMSLQEIFQKTCDLIPPGWQYPDITCARITLGDAEFTTKNFQVASWRMASSIVAGDKEAGMIEVCCLKEMPETHNGPFLAEEKQLLQTIATRLGETIEYRRAEKDRGNMEVQLRNAQKLEAVGQLAAGIAHEINTPIQFVGDNAQFLKDAFADMTGMLATQEELVKAAKAAAVSGEMIEKLEKATEDADIEYLMEEVPKAIEQSLEGVNRVATIVRAMKEFSHQGTQDFTACDINKAIENTIIISKNEWKYVAEMKTELDPSLPMIQGIQGELNQSILNLIVNAAHAIADVVSSGDSKSTAAEKGTIAVRTRHDGDWVEISIADTGTGIPKTARDHIFDPFFTTKEVGKGTGQGLSIVYNTIVEKHGGQLTFETEDGKGTTFLIRLPLKKSDEGSTSKMIHVGHQSQ